MSETIESELGWADMSSASFGEMTVHLHKMSERDTPVLVVALREKEMACTGLRVLLGHCGDFEEVPEQWRFVDIGITWTPLDGEES